MIKAVIIGFAHMHVNEIALYISEQPDFEIVGISDVESGVEKITDFRYTQGWNLNNVKENYCNSIYDDYKKMLDEVKPDIAFILCENSMKFEVFSECAKRKINVSLEKPMSVSYAEAKEMEKIAEETGIEAVVNWPVMWRKYLHKFKNILDSGVVGSPIKMRYLNGHTGPLGKGARHRGVMANADEMTDNEREKTWWHQEKYGGGVFLDICCYGCLFSRWFMGDGEEKIFSYGANLNTDFGDTDDNFSAIIKYPGKMSVIEGTWTTPRMAIPSGPMVVCTAGVIMCTGGAENEPDVKAYDIYGKEIEVPDIDFGDKFKNMPWHWANHVKTGEEIYNMLTLKENVKMMAILDAAMKSSKSGKEEKIGE